MQDCFRQHPDVYGSELEEDEVDEQLQEHIASTSSDEKSASDPTAVRDAASARQVDASTTPSEKQAEAKEATEQVESQQSQQQELSESEKLVPKAEIDTAERKTGTKSTKTEK